MEVEWRVVMRPGRRRKLEPGSEEALAEKAKASVRANVEYPFLRLKRLFGCGMRLKRLFGCGKSLPPSSIGGALPGIGEEHGTPGIAVRGAHRGPGLLGYWTVALPQEAPPIGVSFRPESLSMPEEE